MSDLLAGDIVLSRNHTIGSQLIRWWTRSSWSHSKVMISDCQFIEAAWPRVRSGYIANTLGDTLVLRHRDGVDASRLKQFMSSQLNKRFDWRGLLAFVLRVKIQNKSWYFCSELIAEAFAEIGRPLLRRESSWVTPQDIYQSLELQEVRSWRL